MVGESWVIEEKIQSWLNAQRIGVTSYAIMSLHGLLRTTQGRLKPEDRIKLQEQLGDLQLTLQESLHEHLGGVGEPQSQSDSLIQLPPSTLHLLYALLTRGQNNVSGYVKELQEPVAQVLKQINAEKTSPLGNAQIIGYHILDSVVSARRITRLGGYLWEGSNKTNPWEQRESDPIFIDRFDELLEQIRLPKAGTNSTILAIGHLGDLLSAFLKDTPLWAQLENILLSQTFCWPLLVLRNLPTDLAISLPIGIDINFDGLGETVPIGMEAGKDNRGVDLSPLQKHLEYSVTAAKTLWQSKHGNYGIYNRRDNPEDFRWKVNHSSVIFDFSWANRMSEIPLSIKDGSANAYFAMTILAKLLGQRGYLSSVVTGLIGERCVDKETQREELDYWVLPPGGIAAKLRWALTSRTFGRAALPKDPRTESAVNSLLIREKQAEERFSTPGNKIAQTAEIRYGTKLSHFADIVQVDGWRQDRFIRCPELQWAIHETYNENRPGLISLEDNRVQGLLTVLGNNNSPIVDLQHQPDFTPRVVASALWHANMSLRLQVPRPPPMFSSIFIKGTHDQQDSSFWLVLLRAMGVPMREFSQLFHSPSSAHVAEDLSKILNRFQPIESSPSHRAPDVIVIIGAETFAESLKSVGNPLARNLAVIPVLDELASQGRLGVSPNAEALAAFLGRTRIILVADLLDDDMGSADSETLVAALSPMEEETLQALSNFRWGFTHSMACLFLGLTNKGNYLTKYDNANDLLKSFQEKGALRYGQGWYHIPASLQGILQRQQGDSPDLTIVRYHLAAGEALSPYVLNTSNATPALDAAFTPERVYETFFHFGRAQSLARTIGKPAEKLATLALNLKTRLLRFASPPTWSTVNNLTQCLGPSYADAYNMGKGIIREMEQRRHPIHPAHYLTVARAGAAWQRSENNQDIAMTIGTELIGPEGIYERALKACGTPAFQSERDFNQLATLSVYATQLFKTCPDRLEQIRDFDREILRLIASGADARGIQGEWFERAGDGFTVHSEAADVYQQGIRWVPSWHSTWIKALGAAKLSSIGIDWVQDALQAYINQIRFISNTEQAMAYIVKRSGYRLDPNVPQRIKERWNAGARSISETWGYSEEVQRSLRELKTYNCKRRSNNVPQGR